MKKKKIKIKKKNIIILVLLIVLTFTIIYKGSTKLINNGKIDNNNNNDNEVQDKRLEKLGNIDKKISYFIDDYIDRYVKYKEKNPNLSNEEIVLHVNIGIDNEYYTNTRASKYLNKNTILVNKYNYLEANYIPENLENINLSYARSGMKLVSEANKQYEAMAKQIEKEGMKIIATSSYRSYDYQVDLYNRYVNTDGKAAADTYSARPGYSEHQTGLAVDIHNGKKPYTEFENTEEFNWMQNNAYKYGFILRFPKDKEEITGYTYESWHYRYVGLEIAKYIHDNNLCFEEYYAMFLEK